MRNAQGEPIGLRAVIGVAAAGAAAQAFAFALIAGVVTRVGWYSFFDVTDVRLYFEYAQLMAKGMWPYVGFFFEYPPLAASVLALPPTPSFDVYAAWFAGLMIAAMAVAAALTAVTAAVQTSDARRGYATAGVLGGLVLLTGAIVANRYDAAVAVLLAGALLAMTTRHWGTAGLLVGLGFALKLTPLVLLPLLLAVAARRRDIAAAAAWCAAGGLVPFAFVLLMGERAAANGLVLLLRYHLSRPLEVESVLAAPLLIAAKAGLVVEHVEQLFRSMAVVGPGAQAMVALSTAATLVALGIAYALVWRRRGALRADARTLPLAVLAILLALVTFGKVLSPQYLVWLLPAAALTSLDRPRLGVSAAVVALLTQVGFPPLWGPLLRLDATALAVFAARDVALVALLVLALRELWLLPRDTTPAA
jgi:hypothetical protein